MAISATLASLTPKAAVAFPLTLNLLKGYPELVAGRKCRNKSETGSGRSCPSVILRYYRYPIPMIIAAENRRFAIKVCPARCRHSYPPPSFRPIPPFPPSSLPIAAIPTRYCHSRHHPYLLPSFPPSSLPTTVIPPSSLPATVIPAPLPSFPRKRESETESNKTRPIPPPSLYNKSQPPAQVLPAQE